MSNGTVSETVYTVNSVPVSCTDVQAASDSYDWKLRVAKISDDFGQELANNTILIAFNGGSCAAISNVNNTLEIPPGGVSVVTDDQGIVHASFEAAVPDFSSDNSSRDIDLPFFDLIDLNLAYNPTASMAESLMAGVGKLEVSGNANLCNILQPDEQQCFILGLSSEQSGFSGGDLSCVCTSPTIVDIDVTSLLLP
ncbi:MAG TPA: hypothetical protein VMB26_05025 [Candidatus Binataceae bacterium]|nr:hypothetical protein [Candidatus Binataceae bacterium]